MFVHIEANRVTKAIVVILVVCFGVFQNTNVRIKVAGISNPVSITEDYKNLKTDTTQNDANNSRKFFIYTESVIKAGIQQILSRL